MTQLPLHYSNQVTLADRNNETMQMIQAGVFGETLEEKLEREYVDYMEENIDIIAEEKGG
jgi:hypothetical protein